MMNGVFNLPDFFSSGRKIDVFLHFHTSDKDSVKARVILSQNLICILSRGGKEVYHGKDHVTIDSSQLILIKPGTILMSEKLMGDDRLESTLIFFSNQFLSELCIRHGIHIQAPRKDDSMFIFKKDEFINNYQFSLRFLNLDDGVSPLQRVKIEELLLYLFEKYPGQMQDFANQAFKTVSGQQIMDAVLSNIENNLTVDEFAFLCNMSPSSFKRRFSDVFQTSPKKFFIEKKMLRAKQLLKRNKQVKEIYFELGYESLSSFSKEFKKYFGISPKQFQATLG